MTDRYERIRKALAMGPTPGPWSVRYDYVVQAKSFDEGRLVPIAQPYGLRVDGSDLFANAALIAACDPDTIRAPLEKRDELAAMSDAARDVLAERRRQVEVEGWAPERDDHEHDRGQLACAAGCYALHSALMMEGYPDAYAEKVPAPWPWSPEWWKPKDARRNLVKAGALILAEIERLDRADAAMAGDSAMSTKHAG